MIQIDNFKIKEKLIDSVCEIVSLKMKDSSLELKNTLRKRYSGYSFDKLIQYWYEHNKDFFSKKDIE